MRKNQPALLLAFALLLSLAPEAARQTATQQAKPASTTSAGRAAAPRPGEKVVPFRPGETLTYDVSWSSFLTAGTATVAVRDKRASYGSTAYYIVAEGRPTPLLARLYSVYYKADTLMDVYSLLPQRGSIYSNEDGDRRMKTTRFDRAARTARYEVQASTVTERNLRIPSDTHDALSAIYSVRAQALVRGAKMSIPVADNGELLTVQFTVGAREPVRTGIGTVTAWRIVPAIYDAHGRPETTRRLALWISDDGRRLPLKMQAELAVGTFDFTLRSASGTPAGP